MRYFALLLLLVSQLASADLALAKALHDSNLAISEITGTETSPPIRVENATSYSIQAIIDVNTPSAKTFDTGTFEVQTLTFEALADTDHQDLVIISAQSGTTFAIALTKPVAAVSTLNFADIGDTDAGDYVVVYDAAGLGWAIAADLDGDDAEPTGAIWTAIAAGRKGQADLTGLTDDEDIAAAFETAFNALTGFSDAFTTDDTAADGTMIVTRDDTGEVTASVVKNADDSGAGSIAVVETTDGVTDEEPSGALYSAVDASRRSTCDVSAATTAAQVAAAAELCFDALTGLTTLITTDDSAANGTMTLTQTVPGATTNAVPKNADESGAGGIGVAETTAGVATEVSPSADTLTIPSHGLFEGLKGQLTTTGTLPAGLSLATDYFVIVVDSDTIQLASSLANALAGTEIDITDYGATTSVNTFTPTALAGGAVKVEKSNDTKSAVEAGTATWEDVAAATSVTADAEVWFEKDKPPYKWIRLHYTVTAGSMSTVNNILVK